MNNEKESQQKELDVLISKNKEKEKVEQFENQKQKEVIGNWDNLPSDEKILDTLLNIQKSLSTSSDIQKNQNNKLESIKGEMSNRSVQIIDKLTSLKWSLFAIAIMIFVFLKFGGVVLK